MAELDEQRRALAGKIVRLLEEVHAADPTAAVELLSRRVKCNRALAEHPSVQVRAEPDGAYSVSVLGLLNGLLGSADGHVVIMHVGVDGNLMRYSVGHLDEYGIVSVMDEA